MIAWAEWWCRVLEEIKLFVLVTGHSAELGWHSRRIPLPPEHPFGRCQGPSSSGVRPGARHLKRRPALRGQREQRERAPLRGLERGPLAQRRQLNRVAGPGERRDQGDPERAGHVRQLALRGDAAAGGRAQHQLAARLRRQARPEPAVRPPVRAAAGALQPAMT
jgi:hypothetical protein